MAEVELKFELPPSGERAFRALPALAAATPTEKHLLALYFDTPREELARNAMALRLRRSGKQWIQGLKAGRSGGGGLHAREEWEHARADASIDLALFRGTPLARLRHPRRLHERLEEIFRVDVRRTTWQLEAAPGSRLEVALDRGHVFRGSAYEPVSEVEIECLEGDPGAVFELAGRLLGAVPLRPSALTKAGRGYRLLRGETPGPVKSTASAIDPRTSPAQAARSALAHALAQMQANEEAVLAGDDPEALHQMRASLRRLRSALRVFRPALDRGLEPRIVEDIRWLARILGDTRDWDVLATQTLPALLAARGETPAGAKLAAAAGRRRAQKRAALRKALHSARHARWILALARELSGPPPASVEGRALRRFAAHALAKRHQRLAAAAGLVAGGGLARHRLRIEAKKLRYALEEFAPLFSRKGSKGYGEALSKVQDRLGEANDLAVARRLLARLGPPGAREAGGGWLRERSEDVLRGLEKDLGGLVEAKRFWSRH